MFGLDELKQTRYFREVAQEAKLEGKLEAVPRLLQLGLSVEQIAMALDLEVEVVRQAAQAPAADTSPDEETEIQQEETENSVDLVFTICLIAAAEDAISVKALLFTA